MDPSQRVSLKELEAKDREWRRRQQIGSASSKDDKGQTVSRSTTARNDSQPPSYADTMSQDADASGRATAGQEKKEAFSFLRRKGKDGKKDPSKG